MAEEDVKTPTDTSEEVTPEAEPVEESKSQVSDENAKISESADKPAK